MSRQQHIELLINAGADANLVSNSGHTTLDITYQTREQVRMGIEQGTNTMPGRTNATLLVPQTEITGDKGDKDDDHPEHHSPSSDDEEEIDDEASEEPTMRRLFLKDYCHSTRLMCSDKRDSENIMGEFKADKVCAGVLLVRRKKHFHYGWIWKYDILRHKVEPVSVPPPGEEHFSQQQETVVLPLYIVAAADWELVGFVFDMDLILSDAGAEL
ncbi:hypothetical protein PILCRDRAFT_88234 [Piloderma croceum F 1598]|uniref:Uncharacterized protein n=1 Tax=Piloderma croceum (strain F 1598) TaxID=765440 RepID=A0A0C3FEM6_PILCF|nr:hypothetical protein PILCRDRAFT_88234 [Piloderma croceum F 1598]